VYSPPPPPPAARALVRQIFRLGPRRPDVTATLLSHADGAELEFMNSGAPAHSIAWTTGKVSGTAGDLAAGDTTTAYLYEQPDDDFECVWTALDGRGRMHIWSYDGRRARVSRRRRVSIDEAFAQMYESDTGGR
jgi:hypothetical protein